MSYSQEQITDGRDIIAVAEGLGLSPADTQKAEEIGIMAGLDESGLRNINYGDYPASMGGWMSSSRGVFQQIAAWGPESVREDPVQSAKMFFTGGQEGQRGLLQVPGWDQMPPWQAAQAVQQSEFPDGSNYKAQLNATQQFLAQYGTGYIPGITGTTTDASSSGGSGSGGDGLGDALGHLLIPGYNSKAGASVGDAIQNVFSGFVGFITTAAFIALGLGLTAMGVWRMSAPARGAAVSATAAAAV